MHHPKTLDLQARLEISRYEACGILECLWQWTAQYCPAGDIGRFPDRMIAQGVDWPQDDAERLIQALQESRWIDAHDEHRMIIHDWPDHCNDGIHIFLARRGLYFADGSKPKTTRLSKTERRRVARTYTQEKQDAHEKRTNAHKSAPPQPQPQPLPLPKRSNHKAIGGESERGKAVEAVGDVALRCIADLANTGDRTPEPGNDELGHYRALITQATGGEFRWRGSHLIRVEAILQHPRGPTLIRERVIDPLENSESAEIKSPAAFANHAIQALAKELGVGG